MKFPTITMDFQVIAGHRLMASKGGCRYAHGHNYLFRLTLERNHPRASRVPEDYTGLNEDGMVIDFDELRHALATVLEEMDHCFFVQESDPLYTDRDVFLNDGDTRRGKLKELFKFYPTQNAPTAENLAMLFYGKAAVQLGRVTGKVLIKKVTCVEAPGCEATYSSL